MNTEAFFTLRSLTAVLKAKKLLTSEGFSVKTVKVSSKDDLGCRYGIAVTKGDTELAAEILKKNGMIRDG